MYGCLNVIKLVQIFWKHLCSFHTSRTKTIFIWMLKSKNIRLLKLFQMLSKHLCSFDSGRVGRHFPNISSSEYWKTNIAGVSRVQTLSEFSWSWIFKISRIICSVPLKRRCNPKRKNKEIWTKIKDKRHGNTTGLVSSANQK